MRFTLHIIQFLGFIAFCTLAMVALTLDTPMEFYNNNISGKMQTVKGYTVTFGNNFESLVNSYCRLSEMIKYSENHFDITIFPFVDRKCSKVLPLDHTNIIRICVFILCSLLLFIPIIANLALELINKSFKKFCLHLGLLFLFSIFISLMVLIYLYPLSSLGFTNSVIMNAGNITFEANNTYQQCEYVSTTQFNLCYCGILNIESKTPMHLSLSALKDECLTNINVYITTLTVSGLSFVVLYLISLIAIISQNNENDPEQKILIN